jgi:dihydrolipoamide dehydrogenase
MSEHYQVIVIGSGFGGKDIAVLAARAGLQVLLVEKESLGGTCFHRACDAIRALHRGARCTNVAARREFPLRTLGGSSGK